PVEVHRLIGISRGEQGTDAREPPVDRAKVVALLLRLEDFRVELGVETLYDAPLLGARSDSLEGIRKEQVEQHVTELPAIRPGDLVEPRREFPGRLQEMFALVD